jgi:hypothetical protein
MASMTDYMVLQDGSFELSTSPTGPGDVKVLNFTLPADFTVGTNFGRPLVAFIMNPRSDNVRVGMWVNPEGPNLQLLSSTQEQELTWSNAPRIDQALWEAVDGTKFEVGQANTIVFKVWDGRVMVRDIVLWYQRGAGT